MQDLALSYDLRGNIEQMDDLAQPARNQLFSHDALSRLLSADGAYGLQGFTYDGTGNRLTQAVTPPGGTAATDTYSYPPTSHRLSAISGANPASFGYDAAGNATSKTGLAITYNNAHRASTVSQGGVTVTNVYSASGQRVSKSVSGLNGPEVLFHYGPEGQMLAETDPSGHVLREYVYLGSMPLAMQGRRKPVASSGAAGTAVEDLLTGIGVTPPQNPAQPQPELFYFHTDHLGTPQRLTDQGQQVVWAATYEPFGRATLETELVVQPLRFPGQYFDAETGVHQNWMRDYDPGIGRYLQSDPIGLKGGLNTFAYVGSNPIIRKDPAGLDWLCGPGSRASPSGQANVYNCVPDPREDPNKPICATPLCELTKSTTPTFPKTCDQKCDDFRDACLVAAGAGGFGAGLTCEGACLLTGVGAVFCTTACAVAGGGVEFNLETQCEKATAQCKKKCTSCDK